MLPAIEPLDETRAPCTRMGAPRLPHPGLWLAKVRGHMQPVGLHRAIAGILTLLLRCPLPLRFLAPQGLELRAALLDGVSV